MCSMLGGAWVVLAKVRSRRVDAVGAAGSRGALPGMGGNSSRGRCDRACCDGGAVEVVADALVREVLLALVTGGPGRAAGPSPMAKGGPCVLGTVPL